MVAGKVIPRDGCIISQSTRLELAEGILGMGDISLGDDEMPANRFYGHNVTLNSVFADFPKKQQRA